MKREDAFQIKAEIMVRLPETKFYSTIHNTLYTTQLLYNKNSKHMRITIQEKNEGNYLVDMFISDGVEMKNLPSTNNYSVAQTQLEQCYKVLGI